MGRAVFLALRDGGHEDLGWTLVSNTPHSVTETRAGTDALRVAVLG